ncbi:NDUFAF4 family protein [Nonomuraea sp. FMUSA5-5]|uniref:NDUFAF4 family protein n=1 Tax=Nonomuraea composti TaxID=2720023 RepID=A0ABX1BLG7_9ACTN|nr:NDUFAF4 family protein [Nonomuraea sp. FMUSA5-5]NJP96619.1 NDUFAF4 family protein [Nonomuraea sp. FMUSA5-5]
MSPAPNRIGIDPALMTQLISEIKRLERSWPDADAQIGRALTSIGTSMSGPGTLRDVASQISQHVPDLQRRLDLIVSTQKIGLDKGVVWADETLWVSNSPASGAAAAKTVADQLRKAVKDVAEGRGTLSKETLELLEKHQHDPYFAVALAKEIPPKELKALLERFYLADRGSLKDDWAAPSSSSVMDRLARALSVTLGTASRGVGEMKLPKAYIDELIATDDDPMSGRMVDELLRYGTFDDAFLREIANKVFDNAQKPSSQQQDIIKFGPGLAAALANNARVAQDFFTDPARKPLSFLMRDNFWGSGNGELGRAIEAATTRFRDHGQPPGTSRGYKSALIASWAAHFWSDPRAQANLPDTKQNAARVFSAYMGDVHRAAISDFPEPMGVNPQPDSDPNLPGKQPHGAMFDGGAVKNVMTWAFKDPQALKIAVEGHGEYSTKVLDAQGKAIRDMVNAEFAEWKSTHPDASKEEQAAHRQKILTDNMNSNPGKLFNAQANTLGKSLHLIVDAGNLTNIHEADQKDQKSQAFKDGVSRTLKLVLTPAGDWVVAGYEYFEGPVSDSIKHTEGKAARSQGEETLRESQRLFKDLTANVMMRYGLFGDESAKGSAHPHASENYAERSGGDFLAKGQIIPRDQMTWQQRIAYDEWLKSSPAAAVFREVDRAVWEGFQLDVPPYPEAEE